MMHRDTEPCCTNWSVWNLPLLPDVIFIKKRKVTHPHNI